MTVIIDSSKQKIWDPLNCKWRDVKPNKRQKMLDSFNALWKSIEKAGVATKAFVVYIKHSAESARKFHEAMEAFSKTEEGK